MCGIAPGPGRLPPRQAAAPGQLPSAGSGVTARFGVTALLEDGGDAERAQREAMSDLVVAALSAGISRRVLDFAGGGEERALQCAVIRVIDLRLGGVLGESLEELMTQCEEYRRATAQHLLRVLWHPWRTRLRMRAHLRVLRRTPAPSITGRKRR
ncbi:hypothetical protein ACIOG8_20860 [Streptomyces erythrochromogenes]|uniref:hypothetical protein n=1 Tax=Streptomyces erythrochromogenes TaxID=285574 RepID=UPI00381110A0